MFIETGFVYNDIDSSEFGIIVVRPNDSNGLINMPWGIKRTVLEEKIPLNPIPYLYGVDTEPLIIKIAIMPENGLWTSKERRDIVAWLFQSQYKPLISYDDPDVAFFAVAQGSPERFDTGLSSGYAEIEMRCNSCYGYSYPKSKPYYPSSIIHNNINNSIITLENKSNVVQYHYPIVKFELLSGTSFSVQNLTLGGEIFEFTGLQAGEIIYIDNNKKIIQSSLESEGTYRYSNFNKKWLRLIRGQNRLKITGDINIEFTLQFPMSV